MKQHPEEKHVCECIVTMCRLRVVRWLVIQTL